MYSRKSQAPTGTIRNGAHDPIRAAFATLLCVAPAKNTARFSPKKTPGIHTARTSRSVTRRPVLHRTTFHARLTDGQAPERNQHTGRLGTLDQRRTERKRDHQPENREHPERLRAQPIATVAVLPVAVTHGGLFSMSGTGWTYMLILALTSGITAQGLLVYAQKTIQIGTIGIAQIAQPALAVAWSFPLAG